ncbi:MAG TPA: nucleotidyltransferase family protein [Eudoraea sp.]|nr:nucleotidyltransferase family protein [Eudoraea sp.]
MKHHVTVLILAAGSSSRMGKMKQLLPWKNTTLLGSAISAAKASKASEIIVVLGYHAARIRESLTNHRIILLENREWETGMGSSVRCGMQYVLNKTSLPDAVLIMLCDQPFIGTGYLNEMIEAYYASPKNIIGTAYGRSAGVPALFGKSYFSMLKGISGKEGAREVISGHSDDTVTLNANDLLGDVDNDEDYRSLLDKLKE